MNSAIEAPGDAGEALRRAFGFDDFLPGQTPPLDAILAGRDVLAVMPTGSGKSLLYQLPAAIGHGLVIVASPLIALMRDQLRALEDKGVAAYALNSAQDDEEAARALEALTTGGARLLYVAPERLAQDGTQHLLRKNRIKLFAVDEAHCVSQWGHEFRPDYRALRDVARKLGDPPILAVTATAGPRTRADIIRLLFPRPPEIFVRSFARPNLSLRFTQKNAGLRQITQFAGREKESGIIYVNSRRRADDLAHDLARLGRDALPYHAGLDAYTRDKHQDAFFARDGVVMVATIAFGMGVDKKDVRFIVHADLPTSVEGYYQEIGRAGRDGAPARALCLFTPHELALRWRAPDASETDEAAAGDYARRRAMARLAVAPSCRFQALLAEFGEDSARCGKCDHCAGGVFALPSRLSALMLGWRAALSNRIGQSAGDFVADAENGPIAATLATEASSVAANAPLTVEEARLLRVLQDERLLVAKRLGLPPRAIASDSSLRAIAKERPNRIDHPLFSDVGEPGDFLKKLASEK